jgi:GDP-L-fucose synthase
MADACVHLLQTYDDSTAINVGCGSDLTIEELAHTMARVTGFAGDLVFDSSKPDGTPRKLLDTSRLAATGWQPRIGLEDGIAGTHAWFRQYGMCSDQKARS